ncbi:MAG: MerR family transcriptional regulator, partial [Bacteroidota bacterium]|nr:MerR family transcriptional regulator [Bacteroidota bacterium]
MKKTYHIRDLEEITGIKAHTIRMWEKRYNLIKPERSETNIRYYDEASFKKFLLIAQLYHNNFRISEISKLSLTDLKEKALLLNSPTEEYEVWDLELFESIINFDSNSFNSIIRNAIFSLDLNKVIIFILFPFLHKIDILWKSNSISTLNK